MFGSSNLLNNNNSAYISWKGKPFGQITSSIQKNDNVVDNKHQSLFFKPQPLKLHRRETGTAEQKSNSSKHSTSIDVLNQPGSSLVVFDETDCDCVGNKQTLDMNLNTNKGEDGKCCNDNAFDPAKIARNRARGASIISKKPPSSATSAPYSTDTNQYLTTRGKTYKQNQFHYIQSGNVSVKPGAPGSESNKYAVNNSGNVYCPNDSSYYPETQFKPSNYKFAQQGGVSSAARTSRLNYNTITTNGDLYTKAYGSHVGNALSYGASSDAYTIKDKIGFPAPCDTKCKTK
jgi:hypothetical protein